MSTPTPAPPAPPAASTVVNKVEAVMTETKTVLTEDDTFDWTSLNDDTKDTVSLQESSATKASKAANAASMKKLFGDKAMGDFKLEELQSSKDMERLKKRDDLAAKLKEIRSCRTPKEREEMRKKHRMDALSNGDFEGAMSDFKKNLQNPQVRKQLGKAQVNQMESDLHGMKQAMKGDKSKDKGESESSAPTDRQLKKKARNAKRKGNKSVAPPLVPTTVSTPTPTPTSGAGAGAGASTSDSTSSVSL